MEIKAIDLETNDKPESVEDEKVDVKDEHEEINNDENKSINDCNDHPPVKDLQEDVHIIKEDKNVNCPNCNKSMLKTSLRRHLKLCPKLPSEKVEMKTKFTSNKIPPNPPTSPRYVEEPKLSVYDMIRQETFKKGLLKQEKYKNMVSKMFIN